MTTAGCRGIRGATVAKSNTADAILDATRELLDAMIERNHLHEEDIGSVIFTATPDLDAAYPARAARQMGWQHVPLLCMQEMAVDGSLARCIRVLIHWNTTQSQGAIKHVYLHEARTLRPDLIEEETP